jgi:5-methylcytosine-specific restriction endonuclease McrA
MNLSDDELEYVFDRTSGYCHVCHGKLAFCNYASLGQRGAWEIEHSNPRARGGTDRLNNLYAAHIRCNRSKGARSTRSVRRQHGHTHAPMSVEARKAARIENALAGGGLGLFVGALGGPAGMLLGGLIGGSFGFDQDPRRR